MKIVWRTIVQALRSNVYNYKFLFLFWGWNACLAFILSVPVYNALLENLNTSILNESLGSGFDYIWYVQFRYIFEANFNQLPFLIYSTLGVYLLVQEFFTGGLIAVFNNPKKNHIVDFFYGGVKYWVRMTQVFLISLVFFALAFKMSDICSNLITTWFINSENVVWEFLIRALKYVFLICFLGFVMMFSDYCKMNLAIKDHHKIVKAIFETALFIKKNFYIVGVTFLAVNIIGAIGALGYNLIEKQIPRSPYYFLILFFILQQMLIIFRLFIRMLFYSTGVYLFNELSAEEVSADSQEELFTN
jgi:hypothetical protein